MESSPYTYTLHIGCKVCKWFWFSTIGFYGKKCYFSSFLSALY